jgi:hypothetical protein
MGARRAGAERQRGHRCQNDPAFHLSPFEWVCGDTNLPGEPERNNRLGGCERMR